MSSAVESKPVEAKPTPPPAAKDAAPAAAKAAGDAPAAPAASPPAKLGARSGSRPQRERAPVVLPDPLPEKPVKRFNEPSRAELQAGIDKVDKEVQACFDRLKSTKDFYDQRNKIKESTRPAFEKAKGEAATLNAELKTLFDKKKDVSAEIKKIRDADYASSAAERADRSDVAGAGKDNNSAMRGLRTLEDLNNRIRDLEIQQSTSSMSLQEEKKLVVSISFLTSQGREIITSKDKQFKDERAAKDARASQRKTLEDQRKALDAQIDEKKAKTDEKRKAVDKVLAEQDKAIKEITNVASDVDRDAERTKIQSLKNKIKGLRDNYQKDHEAWYINERVAQEQAKIKKKKMWEAAQAERDAKRKEWEEEQAQYPIADPYQPEKDMCAALIHSLQTAMGTLPGDGDRRAKADSTTSSLLPTVDGGAPKLGKDQTAREVSAGKGTAIGKSLKAGVVEGFADQAYGQFAAEKSGKKNKRGRKIEAADGGSGPSKDVAPAGAAAAEASSSETKLKPVSIEHLQYYNALGVSAPVRRSDLATTLAEIEKKKEYFDSDDKPTKDEAALKKARSAADGGSSGKKGGKPKAPPSAADGAFPGLGSAAGDDAPAVVANADASNRPSFLSVAGGQSAAPAPTVEDATPAEAAAEAENSEEGATKVTEVEIVPGPTAITPAPAMNGDAMDVESDPTPAEAKKTAASVVKGTSTPTAATPEPTSAAV